MSWRSLNENVMVRAKRKEKLAVVMRHSVVAGWNFLEIGEE